MDEKLLGKCGFYCGCCPTYIKGGCKGCVDEHSEGDCYTRDCVLKQGIACCGACEQFPCDTIMTKPHTTVLDKDWLRRKKESKDNCNVVLGWMPVEKLPDVTIYPEFIKEQIYNLDAVPQHFVTK